MAFGDSSGEDNRALAQTFTAVHSGRLTSVEAQIQDQGNTGSLVMEVRPVDASETNGFPDEILASASVPASDMPGDGITTVRGRFGPGAEVVAGQKYALILRSSGDLFSGFVGPASACPGDSYRSNKGVYFAPVDWDLTFSAFVDPAPVAANDTYSTVRDEPLRVPAPGLLANDSDPDADAITAAEVTDPSHGDAYVRADGSFAYFPDEGYVGTDSFSYRARDAQAGADSATVEIAVRDATGPAVTPRSPRPGSTTRDTTPAIKATVTDDVTDLQEADVDLYLNGSPIPAERWGYDAATDLLAYNAPRLPRGKKTVKVEATDAAGNATTGTWSFKIR